MLFWGEFPRGKETRSDLFTPENVYTLRLDSPDPPARYRSPEAPLKPAAGEQRIESCAKTVHLERDSLLLYRTQHYYGLPTDRTMWRSFRAPPREGGSLVLDAPPDLAPSAKPSRIRMLLWGSTDLPDTLDHDWSITLNGVPIGRARWDGEKNLIFESDSIGGFLAGKANTLAFRSNFQGDKIDAILLDWIEIDYQAALAPMNDFVEFEPPATAPEGTPQVFSIAPNFSSPSIRVFDVSAGAELPVETSRGPRKGVYGATFRALPGKAKPHYVAVGLAGYMKPSRMALDSPSDLRGIKVAPEYLVVTNHDFMDGGRELVQRRRAQGLSALLVDIDDVYDEYSYGRFSPEALKLFIDDLLAKPGPGGKGLRYVFLIGDATCDYKHVMKNSENFVPTYNETSEGDLPSYMSMYARDDHFVYGAHGTRVPLAAVGRLPCRTPQELRAFLDKLQEFESSAAVADTGWSSRGIFIGGEGFIDMCKSVAAEPGFAGWSKDTIFATGDVKGNVALQEHIIQSLDQGAAAVYFVGHGALLRWRTGPFDPNNQTDLFTKEHLAKVTNRGRYPVVLTATCYSAMYDNPVSLAESDAGIGVYMVLAEGKGAIACIGHVAKTDAGGAQAFSKKVIENLFTGAAPRLGDAFLTAKQLYYAGDWAGIALIGDPATYFGKRYAAAGVGATPAKTGK